MSLDSITFHYLIQKTSSEFSKNSSSHDELNLLSGTNITGNSKCSFFEIRQLHVSQMPKFLTQYHFLNIHPHNNEKCGFEMLLIELISQLVGLKTLDQTSI
ncbi:hypothetical protein OS493_008272 [Desmophyllum pertusum]|uniref:Uncharacterized protein n=1 Tax=Desmophyllum pertusum TaxID=174260 RepID=A0A9X0A7M1_9CNID|nr:hypothetical protein OS493_008272 [Desmophyllum pertusum]